MTCAEFMRWLDDGRPEGELAGMKKHIATCPGCERQFWAAIELETMLGVVVQPAMGSGFNDAVMRRIHSTTDRRGWSHMLEVCVHVLSEPIVPVSLALAIVIAWQHQTVLIAATRMAGRAVNAVDRLLGLVIP